LADGEEVGWIGEARGYREADSSGAVIVFPPIALSFIHPLIISFVRILQAAVRYAFSDYYVCSFHSPPFSLSVFR